MIFRLRQVKNEMMKLQVEMTHLLRRWNMECRLSQDLVWDLRGFLAILTEQENLRDVVMFPLMKARNQDVTSEEEEK